MSIYVLATCISLYHVHTWYSFDRPERLQDGCESPCGYLGIKPRAFRIAKYP